MRNLILLFAIFFSLCSCELNLDDSPEYYQFTQNDYDFIPTVYNDVGKLFKYRNQLNEEVLIEIISYKISKEKAGGYGSSYSLHYYQNLEILLRVKNEDASNPNCDFKSINFSNVNGSYFVSHFSSKRSPNPCLNGGIPPERFEYPFATTELNINGVNYNKVISIFENNAPYFSPLYTFNKVYFDFKEGIIGFDDTENNIQYRIVNE